VRRIRLAAVSVLLVVLPAAIGVGRWERSRFAEEENAGLRAVRAAVGPLDQPALRHFRLQEDLTCLVYERDSDELALELCFDGNGRLVEAVDRRGSDAERWSLRPDPDAAAIRVDPDEVRRARERLYDDALAEARRRLEEQEGG